MTHAIIKLLGSIHVILKEHNALEAASVLVLTQRDSRATTHFGPIEFVILND
jgi:hypothetical protein